MQIFISYRRNDSQYAAGRLDDYLCDHFGKDNVFFDSRAIEGGTKFRERIYSAINEADLVLPVIGASWFTAADASGQIRIEDENDLVRVEVESALRLGKLVIPVFVGSEVKWPNQLPKPIEALREMHSETLRPGRDFGEDVIRLMRQIGRANHLDSGLLGRWHCRWCEAEQPWLSSVSDDAIWSTEDVVEIHEVLGYRAYARGLNFKYGSFELEGWWSEKSVSFVFSGVGRDEALKGTVAMKRTDDASVLDGVWAQYVGKEDKILGGPTVWSKMEF